MIVKLSDYILEQSISDASVNDIVLEQCVAEINVGNAIVEAYAKQINMACYCEADDTTAEKKQGFWAKLWAGIVKVWKAICEWFKNRWNDIRNLFSKSGKVTSVAKQTAAALDSLPADTPVEGGEKISRRVAQVVGLLIYYSKRVEDDFIPLADEIFELLDTRDQDQFNKNMEEIPSKVQKMEAFFEDIAIASSLQGLKEEESNNLLAKYENYAGLNGFNDKTFKTAGDLKDVLDKIVSVNFTKISELSNKITKKIDSVYSKIDQSRKGGFLPQTMPDVNDTDPNKRIQYTSKDIDIMNKNTNALQRLNSVLTKASKEIREVIDFGIKTAGEEFEKFLKAVKDTKEKLNKNKNNPTSITNMQGKTGKYDGPDSTSSTKAGLTADGNLPDDVAAWYNRNKEHLQGYTKQSIIDIYNNETQRKAIGESYYYIQ